MGLSGIFVNVLGPTILESDDHCVMNMMKTPSLRPFMKWPHWKLTSPLEYRILAKQLRDGKRSIDASVEVLAEYPDYIPWARAQNPALSNQSLVGSL